MGILKCRAVDITVTGPATAKYQVTVGHKTQVCCEDTEKTWLVCLYILGVSLIRLVQIGSTRIDLFFKGREGKIIGKSVCYPNHSSALVVTGPVTRDLGRLW